MKRQPPTASELFAAIGPADLAMRLSRASGEAYSTQRVSNWRRNGIPLAVQHEHGSLLRKIITKEKKE